MGDMGVHGSLWEALLAFQREAPKLQKNAINPHFGSAYLTLDKLSEKVLPKLTVHELVWTTMPGADEQGKPALLYRLHHVGSKEELGGTMPLLPVKSDPQAQGSAITYARRYALEAVLSLVATKDDDGNAATQTAPTRRRNGSGMARETKARLRAARAASNADSERIRMMLASIGVDPDTKATDLTDEQGKQLAELLEGGS